MQSDIVVLVDLRRYIKRDAREKRLQRHGGGGRGGGARGGTSGTLTLPLASSSVSETDSIVRAQDGQVIAIGGLMRSASISDDSQIPGVGEIPVVGNLFRHTNRSFSKRELIILLKPTVVKGNEAWSQNILESQRHIQRIQDQYVPAQ